MRGNTEATGRIKALAYLLQVSAESGNLFAAGDESIVANVAAMIYEMTSELEDEQAEKE